MAKRMAEQMELFEPVERGFDEGGLMDEGGTVDPVSGNDVPPGSTQEEVRDDIPAQLSEGEFVFPADVVRYIGLENLMRMRQEAKQGLAQMDAMGQMGNSEEATVEDDLPFDMYDLDVEDDDERNFNVGGYVNPQANPQTGTYTLPSTGIAGYQTPPVGQTGYTPYSGAAPYFQPVQFTGPQFQTATQTTNLPTFAETVGSNIGKYDELRTYINDAGQIQQIPFKDGKPIYPIPEGYRPQGDQPTAEQPTTPVTTTPVTDQGDDGGGDGLGTTKVTSAKVPSFLEGIFGKTEQPAGSPSDKFFNVTPTDAFAGNAQFGLESSELGKATAAQGMYQMSLIGAGGVGSALAKEFGLMDFNMKDMALAGQTGKMNALNALGYADAQQLSSIQQADLVGKAMSAAHKAAKAGQDPSKAIQDVLNSPSAAAAKIEALNNLKDQLAPNGSYSDVASVAGQLSKTYKTQLDNLLAGEFDNELGGKGVVTDGSGKAVQSKDGPVMTGAGKKLKDTLESKIGRTEAAANLASNYADDNNNDGGMGFDSDDSKSGADDAMGDGGNTTGADESDAIE